MPLSNQEKTSLDNYITQEPPSSPEPTECHLCGYHHCPECGEHLLADLDADDLHIIIKAHVNVGSHCEHYAGEE